MSSLDLRETKYGRCECGGALVSVRKNKNGTVALRCTKCRTHGGRIELPSNLDYTDPAFNNFKGVSTYKSTKTGGQWIINRRPTIKESQAETFARILSELPTKVPARKGKIPKPSKGADGNLLAVYPFGDPHFGMLSWGAETGADYDLKIACDLHYRAIVHLTRQEPRAKHALIILLGDTFHADDQSNVTPKSGHQLDVDGRFEKITRAVRDVTVRMIDEALSVHETVEVWSVGGNHDVHLAKMLGLALDSHYRNEPRCSVDLTPGKFHYRKFGQVLIGSTHGDTCKVEKLQGVMSCDRKKDWGDTWCRRWFTGHIHSSNSRDFPGVKWESFRTLAAPDAYANSHGYRSGRDAHRIVFDKDRGEVSRAIVNAEWLRPNKK